MAADFIATIMNMPFLKEQFQFLHIALVGIHLWKYHPQDDYNF